MEEEIQEIGLCMKTVVVINCYIWLYMTASKYETFSDSVEMTGLQSLPEELCLSETINAPNDINAHFKTNRKRKKICIVNLKLWGNNMMRQSNQRLFNSNDRLEDWQRLAAIACRNTSPELMYFMQMKSDVV